MKFPRVAEAAAFFTLAFGWVIYLGTHIPGQGAIL